MTVTVIRTGTSGSRTGDTLISTLRAKCGFDFALGIPGKVKLADVLNDLDEASLGQLVRAPRRLDEAHTHRICGNASKDPLRRG